jgi:hypothetical protein
LSEQPNRMRLNHLLDVFAICLANSLLQFLCSLL